ncbi:MAG: TetR/AcrR family transcriptional regulator [Thermomicrobiales bacterium]
MAETSPPTSRRHGRPRSEQAKAAILRAADELLIEQGLQAMGIDAVAARAGVSKATIYRWWDSKEALALDAFGARFEGQFGPEASDSESLTDDLSLGLNRAVRALMAPGIVRVYTAFIAQAHCDPAFAAAYHARFFMPLRDPASAVLTRAAARGAIPADSDVEAALDLLRGAVMYRLFQAHAIPDAAFVRTIVAIVVNGLVAGEAARR